MGSEALPLGKLRATILARLLDQHRGAADPELVLGPGIGRDAAGIRVEAGLLAAAADPITLAGEGAGYYAVMVNANDVAVLGATPRWLLTTVLLPPGTDEAAVESLFREIGEACVELGIAWAGGHTEITDAVVRPTVAATLLGPVGEAGLLDSGRARAGDALVLVKSAPIEAVAVIAEARADAVRERHGEAFLQRCLGFVRDPGIGVVREAGLAARAGARALHDPTEGGLATAVHEMCDAAGLGVRLEASAIVIPEEARILCAEYNLDPLGAIASGALLATVAPERVEQLHEALRGEGVPAARIGELVADTAIRQIDGAPLPRFDADEVTRLFTEP